MTNPFIGLIVLVPLVAQWIGLMAMRDQRTRAWWMMITGATIQSLGTLGAVAAMLVLSLGSFWRSSSGGLASYNSVMIFTGWAAGGGSLLFAAGFGLHGLTRRAAREHEQQLEAMTAAMAEELRILRERVG